MITMNQYKTGMGTDTVERAAKWLYEWEFEGPVKNEKMPRWEDATDFHYPYRRWAREFMSAIKSEARDEK